jgi:hypothetical protein
VAIWYGRYWVLGSYEEEGDVSWWRLFAIDRIMTDKFDFHRLDGLKRKQTFSSQSFIDTFASS